MLSTLQTFSQFITIPRKYGFKFLKLQWFATTLIWNNGVKIINQGEELEEQGKHDMALYTWALDDSSGSPASAHGPNRSIVFVFLSKAMLFKGHPAMLISPGDPGMRYPQNVEGEMDT